MVTATLITSTAAASVVSALNRTRPEALGSWIKIGYFTYYFTDYAFSKFIGCKELNWLNKISYFICIVLLDIPVLDFLIFVLIPPYNACYKILYLMKISFVINV